MKTQMLEDAGPLQALLSRDAALEPEQVADAAFAAADMCGSRDAIKRAALPPAPQIAAPLISHFSCCRRSPSALRQLSACRPTNAERELSLPVSVVSSATSPSCASTSAPDGRSTGRRWPRPAGPAGRCCTPPGSG